MDHFGIKDAFDIAIVALLLFYLYRIMKESGTLNIFFGVLAFIVVWVLTSQILELKLLGSILDQFMGIGLLVLVILFQEQIKRFLVELGDHKRWRFLKNLFRHDKGDGASDTRKYVLPIVYACMNMSKTKTGALIVIRQEMPLESYEKSGDIIDADINSRLIENIFFTNSPLPALGISQATDAFAIVVSEETGNISIAHRGTLTTRLSSTELEHRLSLVMAND